MRCIPCHSTKNLVWNSEYQHTLPRVKGLQLPTDDDDILNVPPERVKVLLTRTIASIHVMDKIFWKILTMQSYIPDQINLDLY
mmetsp:Transcript_29848/g.70982  ORF Transcript_29848/g.70982 Transcript_29848/m.70982 type:complete len:83 (+) Transcript_29848:238-486(+)